MPQRRIVLVDHRVEGERRLVARCLDRIGCLGGHEAPQMHPLLARGPSFGVQHIGPAQNLDRIAHDSADLYANLPRRIDGKPDRPFDGKITNLLDAAAHAGGHRSLRQNLRSHHRWQQRTSVLLVVQQKAIGGRIEGERHALPALSQIDSANEAGDGRIASRSGRIVSDRPNRHRVRTHRRLGDEHLGVRQPRLDLVHEPSHALRQRHELEAELLEHEPAFRPAGHANLVPRMPMEHRRP